MDGEVGYSVEQYRIEQNRIEQNRIEQKRKDTVGEILEDNWGREIAELMHIEVNKPTKKKKKKEKEKEKKEQIEQEGWEGDVKYGLE